MSKQLFLLASLASLPLVSHAQTTPASSRFYIGAGANLLTNVPFTSTGVPRRLGPSVTAGLQLGTKLALQVGASYFWRNESSQDGYVYYDSNGQIVINGATNSTNSKFVVMPVLLRYSLTASPKRFKIDGLGGVTVLYTRHHYAYTVDYVTTSRSSEYTSSFGRFNLTLGPAVRYAVAPNIELTANGLVNATLGYPNYRFSDRFFFNVLVGANYTLGQR